MILLQLFFGFKGRIRRSTYWFAELVLFVLLASACIIVVVADRSSSVGGLLRGPMIPVYFAYIWMYLAISAKRCHDRNYPAAMALIMFVPLLGALWALIDLGLVDGTPGPNRYGPSPKAAQYALAA